jgi:hypothetical protein
MPFTRPEDATRLHCEYDLADGIRLVRLECQVDSRPQWGLSVHEWTDEGHPAAYSFSVHQEDESVRYSFRAERVDDTFISGASVLANLNAFILAGSDTASSEAVDSLVREVAGDYFGWPRAPGAPAPLSIEQFKSAESIASDPWPSLTLEDITARAHGESPLNVTSAYCGHMVLAALSHWGSHEPTAFSSLRQGFPEPTLDCTEISEAIREFGGDYEVVTGLTNEHLRTIEQPFLVVTKGGEGDESVRHIQIWQYDSEDTYFRLWSPPRQFGRGQHVNRSEGDSSRVFFVPRGVVAASRKGGTGFVIPALAALLGGVLILAVARLFRSRNVRGAFVAVLLLASLFGASCGSERVETPLAEIEAARGAPLSVVVESRQVVTRSFWVQNVADRDIRVVVQPPGCSCIRVSSEPIEVDRGGRAEVRLELIGGESGMRREVLRVVASDGERSTMEELEVEVLSGPPVYTRPSTVTVAAQPDEMVEQCFDLIIVTCREELEAGSISVVSSPESFVITPAMMREPVKTRTANGKFAHVLACSLFVPPVEPGVYLVNVEVVVDALPELEVERDRREFRIERQITVTVS